MIERLSRIALLPLLFLFALPANAKPPERVVTIGGAITETVYALNAQKVLVGSDTTSYYPSEAKKLPKVGYQRAISAEGVLSLKPDIVMLTEDAGPPAVLKQLKAAGIWLLKLKSGSSVADVEKNIYRIGAVLGKRKEARALARSIKRESAALKKSLAGVERKRVMFVLNHGGGMMVAGKGTAADGIILLSGGVNVVKGYKGYRPLTPEAAVNLEPEVILVTHRGLSRAGGVDGLLKIPGLSLTPAGRKRKVVAMDSLLMLGFGPRAVKAASQLKKMYGEL